MNLQLDFTGHTLTTSQILLDGVLLTSLAINQLSILLNGLERGDGLNSQLATDFLEFVKPLLHFDPKSDGKFRRRVDFLF